MQTGHHARWTPTSTLKATDDRIGAAEGKWRRCEHWAIEAVMECPWGSSGPEIDRLALTRRGVVREARRCDPRVFVAAIRRESSSGEWGVPPTRRALSRLEEGGERCPGDRRRVRGHVAPLNYPREVAWEVGGRLRGLQSIEWQDFVPVSQVNELIQPGCSRVAWTVGRVICSGR